MTNKTLLFDLGQIVATPACLEALQASGETADKFLKRHVTGDFGDLSDDDRLLNEQAVISGTESCRPTSCRTRARPRYGSSAKQSVMTASGLRLASCSLLVIDPLNQRPRPLWAGRSPQPAEFGCTD